MSKIPVICRFSTFLLAFSLSAAGLAHGQTQGQNNVAGQGMQGDNPLIGSWFTRTPQKDGSSLVIFAEYMPNGHWRATSIGQGGMSNGVRMQVWGTYKIHQTGQNRYELLSHADGYAPKRMCFQGGQCQNLPVPQDETETAEIRDANHVHVHSDGNGVFDADAERRPVPKELQTEVPEMLTMAPPPANNGGNAPAAGPNGGRYVTPANKIPGLGSNCDDAQQARVCTVNGHAMYTDSRGCRMCAQ